MLIEDNGHKKILLDWWNNVYKTNISDDHLDDTKDSDRMFDNFLHSCIKDKTFEYSDDILLSLKTTDGVTFYYSKDGKVKIDPASNILRKKFNHHVKKHSIIITNYSVPMGLIGDVLTNHDKIFLRFEIVQSILTGCKFNCLDSSLLFPSNVPTCYLTKDFLNLITSTKGKLMFLRYSSFLLNYFENSSILMQEESIKSDVAVSEYGRWYWKGQINFQRDKSLRTKLIRSVKEDGDKYVSVDFISASPSMLASLAKSKTLKMLVKDRIIHNEDKKYSDGIKQILNIFVHGNLDSEFFISAYSHKIDFDYISKIGGFDISDILHSLQGEFFGYNNTVITKYKMHLSYNELRRRIVNPIAIIQTDEEVIKRHRVYLQGHIHDNIILLTWYAFSKMGVLPLYTVHDSVSFRISKDQDYSLFIDTLKAAVKKIKLPYRIEEY